MFVEQPLALPGSANKDHQRMMLDPMFMILQSLRSFLNAVTPTAVIPTAVAPIAVILETLEKVVRKS